ncbi:MAG: hypothetical protein WD773_03995 [Gemmatimonadales bacterium]
MRQPAFLLRAVLTGALFFAGAAACDASSGPGGLLSGHWVSDTSFSVTIDITLTHRDTVIEGRGTMFTTTPHQLSIIGFYSSIASNPTPIIITFSGVNLVPAIYFGTLASDGRSMRGEYRWAFGIAPDTVTFIRQ